jgi:3-oxoacyl-[acyl-carrier-protein] synthase-3
MSFRIVSTGSYVPERIVTNQELEGILDTSDQWIVERTGIKARHICTNETAEDLAVNAAQLALESGNTSPEELDLILCATVSAPYACPSLASVVQLGLGATCPAMDINAACSAFIFLLDTAAGFFARGNMKKILVVGAEQMSRILDWTDRSTAVIFGDGAGACLLEAGENYLASKLFTKGDRDTIKIPSKIGISPFFEGEQDKPFVQMEGQETFKFAASIMAADIREVAQTAEISESDIDHVIPHQANLRIIDAAKRRLDIPPEHYVVNIDKFGNTSAASIPMALDELNSAGKIKRGDILALSAFGGGLSSAACVIRW